MSIGLSKELLKLRQLKKAVQGEPNYVTMVQCLDHPFNFDEEDNVIGAFEHMKTNYKNIDLEQDTFIL